MFVRYIRPRCPHVPGHTARIGAVSERQDDSRNRTVKETGNRAGMPMTKRSQKARTIGKAGQSRDTIAPPAVSPVCSLPHLSRQGHVLQYSQIERRQEQNSCRLCAVSRPLFPAPKAHRGELPSSKCKKKGACFCKSLFMAEREGFEPSCGFPQTDFESAPL